jgi:hypothetical protein
MGMLIGRAAKLIPHEQVMKILLIPLSHDAGSRWDVGGAPAGEASRGELFDGGPPLGRINRAVLPSARRRAFQLAVLAAATAWLPLAILTAAQTLVSKDGSFQAFITDYGVLARSLFAVPVLVLADYLVARRLSGIVRHFRDAGLVRGADIERFRHIVDSTRRLRDSPVAEFFVITSAFALALTLAMTVDMQALPQWHRLGDGPYTLSAAGVWHLFVSLPILLLLILGWLWRLTLWTRFLWLLSRLDLCLIPSHPDRTAGLKFVGMSLHSLSLYVCAIGAILAGTIANQVLHDGASVLSFRQTIAGFVVVMLVLVSGPLVLFSDKLLVAMRRGAFEYGAMAREMGRQMEQKWLARDFGEEALGASDFSATTDLYSIVANVYTMNIVPVGIKNIAVVVVAALLPFLPVALTAVSPEMLFRKISGFLL